MQDGAQSGLHRSAWLALWKSEAFMQEAPQPPACGPTSGPTHPPRAGVWRPDRRLAAAGRYLTRTDVRWHQGAIAPICVQFLPRDSGRQNRQCAARRCQLGCETRATRGDCTRRSEKRELPTHGHARTWQQFKLTDVGTAMPTTRPETNCSTRFLCLCDVSVCLLIGQAALLAARLWCRPADCTAVPASQRARCAPASRAGRPAVGQTADPMAETSPPHYELNGKVAGWPHAPAGKGVPRARNC